MNIINIINFLNILSIMISMNIIKILSSMNIMNMMIIVNILNVITNIKTWGAPINLLTCASSSTLLIPPLCTGGKFTKPKCMVALSRTAQAAHKIIKGWGKQTIIPKNMATYGLKLPKSPFSERVISEIPHTGDTEYLDRCG